MVSEGLHVAQGLRVGVAGCGPAGLAHLKGVLGAGGMRVTAIADATPARLAAAAELAPDAQRSDDFASVCRDPAVDVVAACLPTSLHAPAAALAMRLGKHVVLETPAAGDLKGARGLIRLGQKYANLSLVLGDSRAFSGGDLAAGAAVARGMLGEPYHIRASWLRVRGTPKGAILPGSAAGWYGVKSLAGGGALADLAIPLAMSAWRLFGRGRVASVTAVTHNRLGPAGSEVEEAATLLVRMEGGQSAEISVAWAANIAKGAAGVSCRVMGTKAGLELFAASGPTLVREFTSDGNSTAVVLKTPKVTGHPALWRHVKEVIAGRVSKAACLSEISVAAGIMEAAYLSAASGKSVEPKVIYQSNDSPEGEGLTLAAAELAVPEEQ
jgi:predicted dehydrogenase